MSSAHPLKKEQPKVLTAIQALTVQNPWIKTPEQRAAMTLACSDGDGIPRVPDAGKVKVVNGNKVQIMHNGLQVMYSGYQGEWQAATIKGLKGIHEPQEEKVFHEVLKRLDNKSTMIELGAWWAYYSMWFLKAKPSSYAYCGEPDPDNLVLGRKNMDINGFVEGKRFTFIESAAGSQNNKEISFTTESKQDVTVKVRTVDSIINEYKIDKVDLLHMDIQGAELDALKGASKAIAQGKIRFVFISTHHYTISGDPIIHQRCLEFLKKHNAHIVAKHTIVESCSGDGLIVASFDARDRDFTVDISLQPSDDSLFRQAELDTGVLWEAHDSNYAYIQELLQEKQRLHDENTRLSDTIRVKESEIAGWVKLVDEITPLKKHLKRQVKQRVNKYLTRNNKG